MYTINEINANHGVTHEITLKENKKEEWIPLLDSIWCKIIIDMHVSFSLELETKIFDFSILFAY